MNSEKSKRKLYYLLLKVLKIYLLYHLTNPHIKLLRLVLLLILFRKEITDVNNNPLSMGFSRQEYWSGLSFPYPGDLPDV